MTTPIPGGIIPDPGYGRNPPTPIPTRPDPGYGRPAPNKPTAEQQLKALDLQIQRAQKDISWLNARIKESAKNPKALKNFQAQLTKVQASLKATTDKRNALQNKIYEDKGQYEELLKGNNRDAYLALKTVFEGYGLGSLAGKIYDFVKNGYSSDTISILLQDTEEYKKRFAANEIRRKAGMAVLSPAEYLAAENAYRQILRQSGLPQGFYDKNSDFLGFLTKDVSPSELQERVNAALQGSTLANASMKEALRRMGIGQSEIAAFALDPNKAMPFIQKAMAKAAIGAEAIARGFKFDQRYAEELATSGISREQAAQAYARIGDEFTTMQTLGSIYGGGWTQRMAEEDVFKGGTAASAQKKRLITTERGQFSGTAGTGRAGLAQRGGQR